MILPVALGAAAAIALAALYLAGPTHALSGRALGGAALLAAALALAAMRQFALAVPVGLLGVELLRRAMAVAAATPSPGGRSEARTGALAMRLDHDSGEMDGEILTGRHAGRLLSQLSPSELQELAEAFEDDPDSLGLLLAYLDRRRGAASGEPPPGSGATPGGSGREMSEAEALRVLGLAPGASREEVRAAHRRLMRRVHPDLGGSDALAAMINAAKARLDP